MADTPVTRLTALVNVLLADYEQATGQAHTGAEETRAALAELAAQERRRRHEQHQASRTAFYNGQRAGRR